MDSQEAQLRGEILDRTRLLIEARLQKPARDDAAPYAGRVYDAAEVVAGVEAMLDFWLTLGPARLGLRARVGQYARCAQLRAREQRQLG